MIIINSDNGGDEGYHNNLNDNEDNNNEGSGDDTNVTENTPQMVPNYSICICS